MSYGNLAVAAVAVLVGITVAYTAAYALRTAGLAKDVNAFLSGAAQTQHAMSRFHVRWYAITMIFLAFDMEMVFMYPWALVVSRIGTTAVIEMFVFLTILMAGVVYAWREGALRWT